MKLDVPFVQNPNDRCVPASVGMILAYFMSDRTFTMPELEKICGYRQGEGSWPMEHWLQLSGMGFEIHVIEEFDLHAFAENPKGYLRSILKDPEALAYQIQNDLQPEATRAKKYLAWPKFIEAWRNMGGSFALNAYRLKND